MLIALLIDCRSSAGWSPVAFACTEATIKDIKDTGFQLSLE